MKGKRVTRREIAVEKSSGNVYADLGYVDSDDMLLKAQIVAKIAEIIEQRRLTQEQAAEILGLTQPKISRLLRCVVQIVVKPPPHAAPVVA
jgi:predicted XRE-type DNA-binding protein